MGRRGSAAVRNILVVLAGVLAATAAPAGTEKIVRQHLDAGRVQFLGLDINGDEFPDSIRVDGIKQALFYFVGDRKGNLRSFEPTELSEEERRFVPDVLVEKDLDGDEIGDLLLYNRVYLEKYAANEQTFLRILAESIHLGQSQGTYQSLSAAAPSGEVRAAILDRARQVALPGP